MIIGDGRRRNPLLRGGNRGCILPDVPMVLSDKTLTLLVLISLGLSVLALFGVVALTMRRRTPLASLADGPGGFALKEHGDAIARLWGTVQQLSAEERRLVETMKGAVRRFGLVRYDAFEDMGGHLSFSAALLTGEGDGLVITSINGRADTRCYAKIVKGGQSSHNLSGEEELAIRQALSGAHDAVTTP
jgi:hypothetical protein